MATHKSVLQNALTQFLGKGVTMFTSLLIVKIITGFGTEFYGDYVTTYEFLAFFGIIADAGLFAIAVKEISQSDAKKESKEQKHSPSFILSNILSIRLILILLVCGIAIISAQFVPTYSPLIKSGIYLTAISMGLTIVAGTLSSVLQARMKIQYFTLGLVLGKVFLALAIFYTAQNLEATSTLLTSHFTLFTSYTSSPFHLFLLAGVISNLIFLIIVYYFARKEVKIHLQYNKKYWKQTLKVSLPYGLALILQTLYLRLDIILISLILGASATGIYGVSGRIMESFLILGVFFGQSILPKISKENENTHDKTLPWAITILWIVALPIMWGLWIFAPQIITILSSPEFLTTTDSIGADTALRVLLPTILFAYLNQLFTFTLVSKNRQNSLLIVNGTALLLNGVLNLIFLREYGIIAAAITTLLCEIIVFMLLWKEIKRQFPQFPENLKKRTRILFKVVIVNTILAAIILLSPLRENLILSAVIAGGLYFSWLHQSKVLFKSQ